MRTGECTAAAIRGPTIALKMVRHQLMLGEYIWGQIGLGQNKTRYYAVSHTQTRSQKLSHSLHTCNLRIGIVTNGLE